jgi:hypothetical protein
MKVTDEMLARADAQAETDVCQCGGTLEPMSSILTAALSEVPDPEALRLQVLLEVQELYESMSADRVMAGDFDTALVQLIRAGWAT